MCLILATQEVEIRRVLVQNQPGKIVCETLSWKTLHKNRAGGVTQGEGPEFKLQYRKKKKKNHRLGSRNWHKVLVERIQCTNKTNPVRVVISYTHCKVEDNEIADLIFTSVWYGGFQIIKTSRCNLPREWRHLQQFYDTILKLSHLCDSQLEILMILCRNNDQRHRSTLGCLQNLQTYCMKIPYWVGTFMKQHY
jgi:hypothetical protein